MRDAIRSAVLLGTLGVLGCGEGGGTIAGTDAGALMADTGAGADPTLVAVESGLLRGREEDGAHAFLGVPFAAPPVGELRLAAPRPLEPWEGERSAEEHPPACAQYNWGGVDPSYQGVEDCLYLNVWTPADRAPDARLPVLFFIHGGGNMGGSASEPIAHYAETYPGDTTVMYEGARLAARGEAVVVVTNYRLGPLGFLAHTLLGIEESGNFGILDQVAALAWVQRNIEAFGGDPTRVLLFGQSGGAYDTCMHMTSPRSEGLFSRAMMMSGICYAHPLALMETYTRDFLEEVGCAGRSDVLACLREQEDPRPLVTAMSAGPIGLGQFRIHPYVDGSLIPEQPFTALEEGRHADVPFVIGTTSEEYAHRYEGVTDATLPTALQGVIGCAPGTPQYQRVLELYPRASYPTARALVVDVVSDRNLTCTSRRIARVMTEQSAPVYRYQFRRALSTDLRRGDGAYHASDLFFLFQHMEGGPFDANDEDRIVQEHMLGYWTRFAESGDPSGAGATAWPEYDPDVERFLAIDVTTREEARLDQAQCDFWDTLAPCAPGG